MKIKKRFFIVPVALVAAGFSVYQSDYFEVVKQIEIFTTLYKNLNTSYVDELNHGKLMTTAINSMLEQVDPYTVFYNEQDVLSYRMKENKYHTESGIHFVFNDNEIFIRSVEKNSSADLAGLKSGDQILEVNGVLVNDFGGAALNLLKSPGGTKIKINYKRQAKKQETELILKNAKHNSVPFFKNIKGDVGYVVLTEFSRTAAAEVKEALEVLKIEGAKSIILDLRNNPGGLLDQAVDLVNLFIPKKKLIVTTKSRIKKHNFSWYTKKDPWNLEIPIVILINESSASASEIVSGSLQDLDRAVIVGNRSFGKGLVQVPTDLAYGTQLKVTTSRYYTPSGRCIQKLDYSNRDEQGKATQVNHRDKFKTEAGRVIYDGGGITPDVILSEFQNSDYFQELSHSWVLFDFSVKYCAKKPNINMANFSISASDFDDFKSFFEASNGVPKTDLEKLLEEKLKDENLEKELDLSVKKLLQDSRKLKLQQLEKNKDKVLALIKDQILSCAFYKEDIYQYNLTDDEMVKTALEILKNPTRYKKILNP